MDDARSVRSFARLTVDHMDRLAELARHDDLKFRQRFPDWSTLLAVCLVQGGARHYVHEDRGVKDLDVYLFYAIPEGKNGGAFPWNRGGATRNEDFGPSELGRQLYTDADREDPQLARKIRHWDNFSGRRVDIMSRAIAPHCDGSRAAITSWLVEGVRNSAAKPTAWHLSRTPAISLTTDPGEVWWRGPDIDEAGIEKGLYRLP